MLVNGWRLGLFISVYLPHFVFARKAERLEDFVAFAPVFLFIFFAASADVYFAHWIGDG